MLQLQLVIWLIFANNSVIRHIVMDLDTGVFRVKARITEKIWPENQSERSNQDLLEKGEKEGWKI